MAEEFRDLVPEFLLFLAKFESHFGLDFRCTGRPGEVTGLYRSPHESGNEKSLGKSHISMSYPASSFYGKGVPRERGTRRSVLEMRRGRRYLVNDRVGALADALA